MYRRARPLDKLISGLIASAGAAILALAGTSVLGPCTYAEANGECDRAKVEWWSTARDVYVDGEHAPEITVWGSDSHLALFLPDSSDALVVEEAEDELRLLSMPKAAWTFDDPQTARSMPPKRSLDSDDDAGAPNDGASNEGAVHAVADGLWIRSGDRHFLVAPHDGGSGALELDELWRRAPVWKDLYDAYEPDAKAVEAFADEGRELVMTVAFGTWCGDSRRSVPRLLKTLEAADNPKLKVELVLIDRSFTDPLDFVAREQVTNVPTVIVRDGDREVGRFVEEPRSAVVETDLAAVLTGRPLPPGVYFDDGDVLLASGVLGIYHGERRLGEEHWRLFATETGGQRLYTRRSGDGGGTETWARFRWDGRAAFAEVTRRADGELSRTRLWRRGAKATSTTRGDATGIVRQSVDWPADAVLLPPGVAGVGLAWRQAGRPAERRDLRTYALASVAEGAPGRMEPAAVDWLEESLVETAAGALDGVALRLEHGERSGRYWLLSDLDMPVAVELDNGHRYLLESLERPESKVKDED
ncbi:MAG: thioredoxin family protein [Acidobacteriota bacterium]